MFPLLMFLGVALDTPDPPILSADEQAAAFRAGGFTLQGDEWRKCEDPGTPSYSPGRIEAVGDLDGDGQPEAVLSEDGTYCYGFTGTGFTLVSRQPDGSWTVITESIGIPTFLDSKGEDGWPDIEIGGPGFCFPVQRWNGSEYQLDRHQYEGRPCQP